MYVRTYVSVHDKHVWRCVHSSNTVNILKICELFYFSILTFRNLGGTMLFFACVLRRLELFAKLEAFSAAIF